MSEESHPKASVSVSQQPERLKIPRRLPIADDARLKRKTDPVAKMQVRPAQEKSATPLTHHTIPKPKGEMSLLLRKFNPALHAPLSE